MKITDERGVTLVELLAAILLTSIIGAVGYSLLFQGYATYDRVKGESELRDEADFIMAMFLNELYTLKLTEINEEKSTEKYICLEPCTGEERNIIGFEEGNIILRNQTISLENRNISLDQERSTIKKLESADSDGLYEITLFLKLNNTEHSLETKSVISVIDDKISGGDGDEQTSKK